MGRTRIFDERDAARAALDVFWDRGFEATAVPDLEGATGLSRSSIYHSFGSKRGLFDAAVDTYLSEVVRPRLAPLQADTVASDALVEYMRGLRHVMADGTRHLATHGCLLLNTATSPVGIDDTLREIVRNYRRELTHAITRGVEAAHPEFRAERTARLGTTCSAHVIAAMTLARVDTEGAIALLDNAIQLIVDPNEISETGRTTA